MLKAFGERVAMAPPGFGDSVGHPSSVPWLPEKLQCSDISREGSKFVAELSFSDSFQVPRDLHRSQSRRTCRTPPSTSPVIGRAQQCRGRVMEPSELPMYGVLLERGPSRFQAFKPYAFLSTGNGGCFHEPDSVLQGTPCPRSAASAAKRGCRPGVG